MSTDFRALCAELVAAWDSYDYADAADATDRMNEAVKDAKAALSQPEPVAPTDEGIPQWSEVVCGDGTAILRDGVMIPVEELVASLNRAERLARWGRPTIKPTPEATDG